VLVTRRPSNITAEPESAPDYRTYILAIRRLRGPFEQHDRRSGLRRMRFTPRRNLYTNWKRPARAEEDEQDVCIRSKKKMDGW